MKKKIIISITIILTLLFIFGVYSNYIDSARVRTGHEPKLTIKIVSEDGTKVTYWGLGYKVIRYPSVSPSEPYQNNRGVKFGSWFMTYKLPEDTNNLVVEKIIDKTKTMLTFSCAEVLESFYEDTNYEYYYNCKKSKYIIVKYTDGSEETVKEALENNRINISELDKYDIEYIKYEK